MSLSGKWGDSVSGKIGGHVLGLVLLGACLAGVAPGCAEEEAPPTTEPRLIAIEKSSLVVGESVRFAGENFLPPSQGITKLVFEGTFIYQDDAGNPLGSEAVTPTTITPIYDGELIGDGQLGDTPLEPGVRMLRWNRFGPFAVPFSSQGNRRGEFKGTVTPVNVYHDGRVEDAGPSWPVALSVRPSIIIRKLEPVVGRDADGQALTANCGAPALRGTSGMPYILEVEAVGIEPAFWIYELAGINGTDNWVEFRHPAQGLVDRLGDPAWHPSELFVFNRIPDDVERYVASIRVTAVDGAGNFVATALPFPIVRPLEFHHDGKRELAEYMDPEVVHGPIIGGIGTEVTYAESHSESRQKAVSVSVSQSWTQSIGTATAKNWSEGFALSTSQSTTNSIGQSHSETVSAADTYGVNVSSSATANVNVASTNGTSWGWNKALGKSQQDFEQEMKSLYGEVSGEVSVEVSGEASVPGLAKAGGKVGTSVGVAAGASSGSMQGQFVGTTENYGNHLHESESQTMAFGSATTDTQSESVSGTYALANQNTINNTSSETAATSESVTYNLGGSESITENFSVGQTEAWSQTWVSTTTDTQLLQFRGKVPNQRCAVVYRQTVRYVRRAQLYNYNLCGVREHAGEMYFNEWTWSPNIVIGDNCVTSLPASTLPPARCFIACD